METDKKSLIQHLFGKNDLRLVEEELLKDYLTRYPYFAHLYWVNAIKNKTDKGVLKKAGLRTFYPALLQASVERGVLNDTPETFEAEREEVEEKPGKAEIPISPIQPLYTEDYFAYTKTKLPDKIEDDKPPTMEQVKSFTGWLKMMKNTAADDNKEASFKEVADNEEDDSSDESLHNEEIVTESMAKIWADNGEYKKAKDIYEKLILLNPEKKTYFATKINALKQR